MLTHCCRRLGKREADRSSEPRGGKGRERRENTRSCSRNARRLRRGRQATRLIVAACRGEKGEEKEREGPARSCPHRGAAMKTVGGEGRKEEDVLHEARQTVRSQKERKSFIKGGASPRCRTSSEREEKTRRRPNPLCQSGGRKRGFSTILRKKESSKNLLHVPT